MSSGVIGLDAEGLERAPESPAALTAILSDAAYAARPFHLGDTVPVGWDAAAAHRLDA